LVPESETNTVFAFGPFALDVHRGTLSKDETQVFLRPKAFNLLHHLAQNMGRVVPKAELMDAVWPGIYVTEDSLTQSIREIRKATGDSEQQLVRTISRRGYMLIGEATREPEREEALHQPVVAVLRFRNESGDPMRAAIVDGFAEDIISGLARYGSFTVLAHNSTFQFASNEPDARAATVERIGADYLVEGSVRWSGNASLVTVSLIDARNLRQLWGERYEAEDIELFAVQREIGEQIVNRIALKLDEEGLRHMATRPAASLAAYELVRMGIAVIRGLDVRRPTAAIPLFERAIEKDPTYGVTYGWLALAHIQLAGYGRAPAAVLEEAQVLASRAISLSPDSANGPRVRSLARLYLRQFAGAERDNRMALDINRYDADSIEQLGYLLVLRGKPLEAVNWIERAMRLNPIYPEFYHYDRGLGLYGLGEYEQAIETFERPSYRPAWVEMRLAAAYAMTGNADAARRHVLKARALDTSYEPLPHAQHNMPYEHQTDADHLVEGIEKAIAAAR
jgi:TolB-like protein